MRFRTRHPGRAAGLAAAAMALLGACDAQREGASSVLGAPPAAPGVAVAAAPAPASAPALRGTFRATLTAASGGDLAFVIDGQAALQRDPASPTPRYRLDGEQVLSVTWIRCTATASPAVRPLVEATLSIDDSQSPPRYTLQAGSPWDATVDGQCPGLGRARVPMRVPGRLEVSGTVGADGSIAGSRTTGDLRWEWSFVRPG